MKFSKLTTVLLNVVLILFIAILFKNLLSSPKTLAAGVSVQYTVIKEEGSFAGDRMKSLEFQLNEMAKQGWRLHSIDGRSWLIFEK